MATRTERSDSEAEAQLASAPGIGSIVAASEVGYVVALLASPLSVAIDGDPMRIGGAAAETIHY